MQGAPRLRRDDLYIEEVGGGLVVFDARTGRAHALGHVSARVLQACDGRRPCAEIAAVTGLHPEAVQQALDALEAAELLDSGPGLPGALAPRTIAGAPGPQPGTGPSSTWPSSAE